jgi:hypothetical protein
MQGWGWGVAGSNLNDFIYELSFDIKLQEKKIIFWSQLNQQLAGSRMVNQHIADLGSEFMAPDLKNWKFSASLKKMLEYISALCLREITSTRLLGN